MLCRLSPPLGLGPTASSTDVLRFVFDLDIPLINGRVPFQRTAYELVRRCSGAEIPQGILKDQVRTMEQPPGVISTNKGDVKFSPVLQQQQWCCCWRGQLQMRCLTRLPPRHAPNPGAFI